MTALLFAFGWLVLIFVVIAAMISAAGARRPRGGQGRDHGHAMVDAVERGHVKPVVDESGKVRYRITEAGKAHLDARIGRRR